MITLQLDTTDLESFHFAYSPLIELVMSYKLLNSPALHGQYERWTDEAQRALHGIELPFMQAVILPRMYIADFVTQTPATMRTTFEEDLANLLATPPELIYRDLQIIIEASTETEVRRYFMAHPHEALECLVEELRLYWSLVIAHHWTRIRAVIENDVLFRAREMALYGLDTMFANLNPMVQYVSGQLILKKSYLHIQDMHHNLEGRGLQLVPVLFKCSGVSWQVTPEWSPMVIYGVRGVGLWHPEPMPDPEAALTLTLGEGKAKLLHALRTPSHTSELAHVLSVTSGAVSQQLGRLNQAGLVESHRSGNKVYYRLTQRGEKLLTLFAE